MGGSAGLVYSAAERLRAIDVDGIDYSMLYPTVSGMAGEVSAGSTI